jgi:uncharacterized protein YjiS (DUF1127 family)
VVANWIAANDDNADAPVLSVVEKTSPPIENSSIAAAPTHLESTPQNITQDDARSLFDYDVATRRARKAQAEAIVAVGHTIGTAIGRIVSSALESLRDHFRTRREIQRLSYLTPRMLDDIGISHEIRARVRAFQAYRQPSRFHLHL